MHLASRYVVIRFKVFCSCQQNGALVQVARSREPMTSYNVVMMLYINYVSI